MKIVDINARFAKYCLVNAINFYSFYVRWQGSHHDQSIFNFSKLKMRLENNEFGDSVLIGDAGYACKNYLITPLVNPETSAERRFQKAVIKTRTIVERTIGVWKRRFPVLSTSKKL